MLHFGNRFHCASFGVLNLTRVCSAAFRQSCSGEGAVSHRMDPAFEDGRNRVVCVQCQQSLAATRPLVCASEVHTRQKLSRVCMGPAVAGSTRYRAKRFDVVVTEVDEAAADTLPEAAEAAEAAEDAESAQKQDNWGEDQGAGCAAVPTGLDEASRTHVAGAHTKKEQDTQEASGANTKKEQDTQKASGAVVAEEMATEDELEVSGAGHASMRTRARALPSLPSLTFTQCLHEFVYVCIHCTHARTHAHTHTHRCTHICTQIPANLHIHICTYSHVCTHRRAGGGW